MPRPVRIVVVGTTYLLFTLVGGFITHLLLPLALLGTRDPDERVAKAQLFLRRCMRRFIGYMSTLGLMKLRFPDVPELLERGEPVVVIANHPSLLDVVLVIASLPRLSYVAKASWFKNPFVGPMLRRCGHIPGPDGDTPAAGTITLQRMLETLEQGRSILVFPEGTRSPLGGLLPFARGAFEAAVRARVPLVPCVISVDPPMLRKDQPWYDIADEVVRFEVRLLPPLLPDRRDGSAKVVARHTRELYLRELGFAGERSEATVHMPSSSPG